MLSIIRPFHENVKAARDKSGASCCIVAIERGRGSVAAAPANPLAQRRWYGLTAYEAAQLTIAAVALVVAIVKLGKSDKD